MILGCENACLPDRSCFPQIFCRANHGSKRDTSHSDETVQARDLHPHPDSAIKKTPLLVQSGQGDGDSHFGLTNTPRQRHIWCTKPEIDDRVFLATYSTGLNPTLALSGPGDGVTRVKT